jgi:hypothetical protein
MSANLINKFFGGMVRDEKSKQPGVCSNIEELDIFENHDYIRPTQIMSTDSMPASTEIYGYCADNADTVFGYGRETAGSKVRIVSVSSGGGTNPGAFATLFTASSVTYYISSPIEYHRCSSGDANRLYWLSKNGSTISLNHCTTSGTSETLDGTLTGLDGTNDKLGMRRVYGELYIMNGQYVAKVDDDGVFTEKAYTLPNGWEAVDICEAGTSAVILARNININANFCKGFFWDLTTPDSFDDAFDIPFGGPQWVVKHGEKIKIMCASGGKARFYQVSAYAGGVPTRLKGIELSNVGTEADATPISSSKMVSIKDDILYFGVYMSAKTGIYALGQLDEDKNFALVLAKRFDTSDYSLHVPRAMFIQGPNFYASFASNGTSTNTRCETQNSPTRSSNAVYETVVLDDENVLVDKKLMDVFLTTQPLPASTTIAVDISVDYASYTPIKRPDATDYTGTGLLVGAFKPKTGCKSFKLKLTFTSSGTNAIKLTGIGWMTSTDTTPAKK